MYWQYCSTSAGDLLEAVEQEGLEENRTLLQEQAPDLGTCRPLGGLLASSVRQKMAREVP